MTVALLLMAMVALAGCATSRYQEAMAKARQIADECEAKRRAGELPSRVVSVQCSNDRMRRLIAESRYPYMDLVDLRLAHRLSLAQRLDTGNLTEEDARLEEADMLARINGEIQRRDTMAAQRAYQREQLTQQELWQTEQRLKQQMQELDRSMNQRPIGVPDYSKPPMQLRCQPDYLGGMRCREY